MTTEDFKTRLKIANQKLKTVISDREKRGSFMGSASN